MSLFNLTNFSKKALIFGTNYSSTENELKCCIRDCKRIGDMLESLNFKVQRSYAENTPVCLTSIKLLEIWFSQLIPGDQAIFYYSGHGTHLDEPDMSQSEGDQNDEAMFLGTDCLISDDYLRKLVQKIPRGVKLFCIFDCCESGSILDLPIRYEKTRNYIENSHKFDADILVLSGCRDGNYSYESDGTGHLTQAFLQAVYEYKFAKTRNAKKLIENATWYSFYMRVVSNMQTYKENQRVQLSCSSENVIKNFWL